MVVGVLGKGERREIERVDDGLVVEREPGRELAQHRQVVAEQVVSQDEIGPTRPAVELGEGIVQVEASLALERIASADGADAVDVLLALGFANQFVFLLRP